ncbi:hypothetical protein [Halorarius litoreus]|uniref:hypothetical protein n=1 Tax=Halorarius litoreus TaxID=2962676 RepID=UPI0020CD2801|nr:hypothetical protein [Halorarius litoreus]
MADPDDDSLVRSRLDTGPGLDFHVPHTKNSALGLVAFFLVGALSVGITVLFHRVVAGSNEGVGFVLVVTALAIGGYVGAVLAYNLLLVVLWPIRTAVLWYRERKRERS